MKTMSAYPDVTRVEVIDASGRAFVRYYKDKGVTIQLQDEGRTLKVFAGIQKAKS